MDATEAEIGQISFFLAKEGENFDSVLDENKDISTRDQARLLEAAIEGIQVRFHYFETYSTRKNPPWMDFVNECFEDKDALEFSGGSKSPNGLLLLNLEDRVLVATFGRSSVSHLDKRRIEPDFGIITAMNLCGNEEIRQTRSQSHSITPTQIDRQVGRPADAFVFGLSEAEDLKYISAHMKGDSSFTLQGRDNLTIKLSKKKKLNWEKLVAKCHEFVTAYQRKDFVELFPNYKNFKPATEAEVEVLDSILLEKIKNEEYDDFQIGIPEFVSDDEFSFSYSNNSKREDLIYSFLQSEQLKTKFPKSDKLRIEQIKNNFVYAYSHPEDRILPYRRWRLYNCLIFEAKINDKYFVLSDGRWLEVDTDFHTSVLDFTKSQICEKVCPDDVSDIDIADIDKFQNREEIFNDTVCELRERAIKFDQAKLKIGEGPKNKEFCDILDSASDDLVSIIHCKPYKDSSSTVYLFSQAQLYCEAFLSDQVFLAQIREHIENSESKFSKFYLNYVKPDLPNINGRDYEVCLWLLYDRTKSKPIKEEMPLMAQYELKLLHERLRHAFKYKQVSLTFVPVKKTNFEKKKKPKETASP